MVVGKLEDGPVADHLSILVAERPVPDLADLEAEHVVREDPVRRAKRILAPQLPLPERRLVPNTGVLADSCQPLVGRERRFVLMHMALERVILRSTAKTGG
jgi:hypothetical protein